MAEPMHARVPARHPANRRPRIPHPYLAPQPERDEEAAPAGADAQETEGWTAVDVPGVPLERPASRSRRGSSRKPPAETALRSALYAGLLVNLTVLVASRLWGWSYGGDDFLLAAAVLLSGYALLAVGRISRRDG
jgi:hypothetical protein